MSTLPFFENTKIYEGKSLRDKEVAEGLKTDLDQLTTDIQKLPALTKLSLNFIGVTGSISNAKKAMDNIVAENSVEQNVNELRKNMNNRENTLSKNKQFDKSIKGFLGEDYSSRFKVVCDIVNRP